MELSTDRLRMRPFTKKDFEAVHSYASDAETVKYMTFGPNTKKDTKRFLTETVDANKRLPRLQYDFALEKRDSGRLIGAVGLYLRDPGEAEAGWILHRDFQKNGYMTEAAAALIDFAFSALKLHRVYARCYSENYGSRRVMENCGMRNEAHYVKKRKLKSEPDGPWRDEYLYAVLGEEWVSPYQNVKNDIEPTASDL